MVDNILKIAQILNLPFLEEETIRDVNKMIRDLIGSLPRDKPAAGLSPQQQAAALLGADTVGEWLYGPKEGETS
ncbi:hypothetical protein [Cohnella sp. AR92]|uniref:hypothetical protein n=1 Tax=Cohnella sp. AR92 TaxID=648716 RepID=UPI000F8E8DE3|nr:hypothetical protein [Cohnella sp. AR92]RUS42279.1 hypothetical protein ELR57_27080 [Cohnella sp. AR92]